jgi:hypothetical protein
MEEEDVYVTYDGRILNSVEDLNLELNVVINRSLKGGSKNSAKQRRFDCKQFLTTGKDSLTTRN